jgi:hypothetical protein
VTFTPSRPFSAGETVLVNPSHDVRAVDSTPLRSAGFAWQFTVASQPATRSFQQIDVKYRSRDGSSTGAQTVKLKEGLVDGKASILLKAKGAKVVMPDLDALTGPVTVQLYRSGGGPCFGATYSAPFRASDATLFKDKSD